MNELAKKLLNYFLIGVFAVIPIVIVLQIIIFVKGLVSEFISTSFTVFPITIFIPLWFSQSVLLFWYR